MNKVKTKKFNLLYWLSFAVATISITEFFTAYKFFAASNPAKAWTVIILSLFVFIVSLFYLAYSIYADEKDRDNLRSEFMPFEYLYKRVNRN